MNIHQIETLFRSLAITIFSPFTYAVYDEKGKMIIRKPWDSYNPDLKNYRHIDGVTHYVFLIFSDFSISK